MPHKAEWRSGAAHCWVLFLINDSKRTGRECFLMSPASTAFCNHLLSCVLPTSNNFANSSLVIGAFVFSRITGITAS
jgi:hypothetical protein